MVSLLFNFIVLYNKVTAIDENTMTNIKLQKSVSKLAKAGGI
jgi:hypothetical protein